MASRRQPPVVEGNRQRGRSSGRNGGRFELSAPEHGAIAGERPADMERAKIQEMMPVGDFDADRAVATRQCGSGFDVDRLMDFLHLPILRVYGAVGVDNSLDAKHSVVRYIAEVAAVRDELSSISGALAQSLVNPFPDEPAEEPRMRVDFIPVFLEVANGIAHGVRVFSCQNRPHVIRVPRDLEQVFPAGVSRRSRFSVGLEHARNKKRLIMSTVCRIGYCPCPPLLFLRAPFWIKMRWHPRPKICRAKISNP